MSAFIVILEVQELLLNEDKLMPFYYDLHYTFHSVFHLNIYQFYFFFKDLSIFNDVNLDKGISKPALQSAKKINRLFVK